jgi:transposase
VEGENLQKLVKTQAEIIKRQAAEIKKLEARIAELEATIACLQKDSRNSSKPPSSDIVKPKKEKPEYAAGGKKRKIGGQPGHTRHERPPFSPEQVDETVEATMDECPVCGGALQENEKEVAVQQQIDIVEKPFIVREYHRHTYWCPACQSCHTAPMPGEGRSGLFSTALIAFVAYLKGRCHISFSALQDFFHEVLGIKISRGFLAKQIRKTSAALKRTHEELMGRLGGEGHLHIDESGWKENGEKRWIGAFRAERYAVFIIRGSRGAGVLEEVLGKAFGGIISCDFYGAYRKFQRLSCALLQLCWAHFIREVLFLQELGDERVRRYGRRVIKQIRLMFETIHRKGELKEAEWKDRMNRHRELIVKRATGTVPENREAQLIGKRMRDWEEEYFRFIDQGLEATNNAAELTIRQSVLDRVVTQGSRGIGGNEWHERFWTVITTCGLQDTPVMDHLKACLSAYFGMGPFPHFANLPECP